MNKLILTLALATSFTTIFAQEFKIPKNYKLEKEEDYASYEKDIISCIDWLMKTPINEQATKRKEANKFLLTWLAGSPNVTIEVNANILTFIDTSPELMTIFMGGWTKYALESKNFNNKSAGNIAGIESVIEFYTKNKGLMSKDKNVEKYIKMKEKGTLKEYIEKNI